MRQQQLEEMLTKIVNRASRAKVTGSTEIRTQEVPEQLLLEAVKLLRN